VNSVIRRPAARRVATTGLALALAGAGVTGTAVAASTAASTARSTRVVDQATRGHFGKILVTLGGRSLYYLPKGNGSCTGGCLGVWPPLFMPAGKTMPAGASCLGVAKFGHRLQVTYRGRRLYTFVSDSGHSVTGNGVEGFVVAKATTHCR
jgi:predicted lipoprotein with Yx(FWY)xxD motif